jgi:hypothetical protein
MTFSNFVYVCTLNMDNVKVADNMDFKIMGMESHRN